MKKIIIAITLLFTYSCSKETFLPPINSSNSNASASSSSSASQCAKFTYIRPPVDLLFLWDNSSSSIYINNQTKTALTNLINTISERFDYNVMLAPILGSGNSEAFFFSRSGINPGNGITKIQQSQAASVLDSFSRVSGGVESGTNRAISLLNSNQSNGAFRKNAYTIVITMSNEDDDAWKSSSSNYGFDPARMARFVKAKSHDLLCLRGNYDYANSSYYDSEMSSFNANCTNATKINSLMMRYLTVTANQSPCSVSSNVSPSEIYTKVSKNVYNEPYTNGFDFIRPGYLTDQFDICSGDYVNIFSGINDAISDAILAHEYNYWPLSDSSTEIDENSITVQKSNGTSYEQLPNSLTIIRDPSGTNDRDTSGQRVNGFRYVGNGTFNTRYAPSTGELYNGQAIELFGDAKVKYPECLLIQSTTATQYFGYAYLEKKPVETSIVVTKNGVNLPQSTSNGWEVVKSGGQPMRVENFNTRITSPSDYTPKTPGVYKSGYFLKLNGNGVYQSGDNIKVNYSSTGN